MSCLRLPVSPQYSPQYWHLPHCCCRISLGLWVLYVGLVKTGFLYTVGAYTGFSWVIVTSGSAGSRVQGSTRAADWSAANFLFSFWITYFPRYFRAIQTSFTAGTIRWWGSTKPAGPSSLSSIVYAKGIFRSPAAQSVDVPETTYTILAVLPTE